MCGSCRAVARINRLLKSGSLRPAHEPRVLVLLRGVAGEIADLAEGNTPGGLGRIKEESIALTSGAGKAPSEVPVPKVETKAEVEEAEENAADNIKEEAESEEEETDSEGDAGDEDPPAEGLVARPVRPRDSVEERRLGLTPAPKANSLGSERPHSPDHPPPGAGSSGGHHGDREAARGSGDRYGGEARPPLERRRVRSRSPRRAPPQGDQRPKKKKKSKGKQHRKRGQEYRRRQKQARWKERRTR